MSLLEVLLVANLAAFGEYIKGISSKAFSQDESGQLFSLASQLSDPIMLGQLQRTHDQRLIHWERIDKFQTLKQSLQPVIESTILFDRYFYLQEKGFSLVKLVALFGESLSPRNVAIIGTKLHGHLP